MVQKWDMGRPVEIDRNRAFQNAYDLFWQRGYRSTSIQDLLDAMNIGRGSFYAAFESKEALFLNVLSEYHRQGRELLSRIRSRHVGVSAIRALVDETLLDIPLREMRKGCLAVNSALELADVNKELHRHAIEPLRTLEKELKQIVREGQEIGEIEQSLSPEMLARILSIHIQGLRVSSRTGMSRSEARASVDALLERLSGGNQ